MQNDPYQKQHDKLKQAVKGELEYTFQYSENYAQGLVDEYSQLIRAGMSVATRPGVLAGNIAFIDEQSQPEKGKSSD